MAKRKPLKLKDPEIILDGIIMNLRSEDLQIVDRKGRVRGIFPKSARPMRVVVDAAENPPSYDDWLEKNDQLCKICGVMNQVIPLACPQSPLSREMMKRGKAYYDRNLLQVRNLPAFQMRSIIKTYYVVNLDVAMAMALGGVDGLERMLVPAKVCCKEGKKLGYQALMPAMFLKEG